MVTEGKILNDCGIRVKRKGKVVHVGILDVYGVLETWTNSFGFAKMTNFERSQFLDSPSLVLSQWLHSP